MIITLFLVQLVVFTLVALNLHALTPRLGLAPMLLFVGGMMGLLNVIELLGFFIEIAPGVVLRPGGHVLVPVLLLTVLVLYVCDGTHPARLALLGMLGIDVLVVGVLLFLVGYMQLAPPDGILLGRLADPSLLTLSFLRGVVASIIAFGANLFVIIVVYQGILNAFPRFPNVLVPGVALLLALWTDSVVYNIGANFGTPVFMVDVASDTLVKSAAGLVMLPFVGYYLTRVAPNLPRYVGADGRPTLAIIRGDGYGQEQGERLEAELRESRSMYSLLMENIEAVFWLVDIEKGRVSYVSPAFKRLTGHDTTMIYQDVRTLLNIIHPEDRPQDNNLVAYLTGGAPEQFRLVCTDETIRWFHYNAFPVTGGDGVTPRFYAGLATDITAQRAAQEQTFALELSRERVRVLNDFIQDASHDLKTPLSTILLKVDMLERVNEEKRPRVHQQLREQAYHLTQLIEDVFTLSRVQTDQRLEMDPVDLNMVVREVIATLYSLALDRDLIVTQELTEDDCVVEGVRDDLTRVVGNLVANGLRYTAAGGVTVRTITETDHVVLTVADTGIGISEADQPHIFDRFYRSENAADFAAGTGLGLAIVAAVVEQHEGTITVESKIGAGTTFTVRLPRQA